jgi:hypothetical protein
MSFQWLQMRITEEKDRRAKESSIFSRLPSALEELRVNLGECVEAYNQEFAADRAKVEMSEGAIHITARDALVRVSADTTLPGFRVERGPEIFSIEVGLLPGDRLFFRDSEKYLSVEEVTRRILDRLLFPKLGD